LRIKRFTQQVTELFSITPSDEGRPVTDFAHRLEYDGLVKDAQAVLSNLTPIRREVHSRQDRWYDVRLRPYRTVDNRIDGVVITFVDITELLQVEQALRDSEQRLRQEQRLIELSHEPIFIWDLDRGIQGWNRGSEDLYGYTREEAVGKHKEALLGTEVLGSSSEELRAKLLKDGTWNGELRHKTKSGREITVESRIVLEALDGRKLALESTRDITDRKLWEQRQQLLLGELTHRVKNTLSVVQSIAHYTLRSSASSEDFVEKFDGRLAALASAHSLLVDSNWKGADLGELARHQLAAYTPKKPGRLQMEGEAVSLPADLATPFGLVLHELATNASKYGAFSTSNGLVRLSWTMDPRNNGSLLRIVWQESNGPPTSTPNGQGFGSILISRGIPNAVVTREFKPEGLLCTIDLPLTDVDNGREE
jgi:two-component system CheB/CheR fusion protein